MRRVSGAALALGFGWIACVASIVIDAAFEWWPSREQVIGPGFSNLVLSMSLAAMALAFPISSSLFALAYLRLPSRSLLWRWPAATLGGALVGAAVAFTMLGWIVASEVLSRFMLIAATAGATTGLAAARIKGWIDDVQPSRASLLGRLTVPIFAVVAMSATAVYLVAYVYAAQPDAQDEHRLRQSLQFLMSKPCVASVDVDGGEFIIWLKKPRVACDYREFLEAARRGNEAYRFEIHGWVMPVGSYVSKYSVGGYDCEIGARHGLASGTGACRGL